jgi:hypothetical protein
VGQFGVVPADDGGAPSLVVQVREARLVEREGPVLDVSAGAAVPGERPGASVTG